MESRIHSCNMDTTYSSTNIENAGNKGRQWFDESKGNAIELKSSCGITGSEISFKSQGGVSYSKVVEVCV